MAKTKKKSNLSLGRKKWAKRNTSSVPSVTFKVPSTETLRKSPSKKASKRLLTPSKSPLYSMCKSPFTKRFKAFRSPLATKQESYRKEEMQPKSSSRSLFRSTVPDNKSSLEDEEEQFKDLQRQCELQESLENSDDDSAIENASKVADQPLQNESSIECDVQNLKDLERQTNKEKSEMNGNEIGENKSVLIHNDLLSEVLLILSREDGLDAVLLKFLKLVKERKFPLDNIAFLLFMEVVQWFDCENTSRMRYSDKTKMFWKVGWRIFGGRFIHFMNGYKNREEVVLGISNPGKASPQTSTINFAVPDTRVLRGYDKYDVNENWQPGIQIDVIQTITQNLGHKSACLTYDGKKVKQGLTENSGDVDILGYELGLTLEQRKDEVRHAKEEINDFSRRICEFEQSQVLLVLPDILKRDIQSVLLRMLKRVSTFMITAAELKRKKEYCKEKLIERSGNTDWRKGKYVYAISAMMAFLYDIDKFLSSSEIAREKICTYVAYINESPYVQGKTMNLSKSHHYIELPSESYEVEVASTRLIKQRSEKWFEIRKRAKVTGSTLFKALGCDGLEREKDHFESVVCGVPEKEPSDNAKAAMKHGTDNEENGVATMVGKVVPVLMPGAMFFEEGCIEVFTDESEPFLVVSPDGSLRNNDSFESTFAGIEIKCPVMKLHSEFPPRYLLQCLSEIEVLGVDKLLYISWTKDHSNVFKVERDKQLFQKAMKLAYNIYNENNKKPTKLTDEQKSLKAEILEKAKHIEFIGTFSSVMADTCETVYTSDTFTVGNLTGLLQDVNTLTSEHYELNRERASEAIVFIVADLDRGWERGKFKSAPVCWFPKGYSLSTNTMRKIADDVHTICHEHNIHIPCESFDGQWHNLVVRSSGDRPLTILQLQKDVWKEDEKTKKSVILTEVKNVNCNPKWDIVTEIRNGIATNVIYTVNSETRTPKWRPEKKIETQRKREPHTDPDSTVNLVDVLPECVANSVGTSATILACTTVDNQIEQEAFSANVSEDAWVEELEEILESEHSHQSIEDADATDIDFDNNTDIHDTGENSKVAEITKSRGDDKAPNRTSQKMGKIQIQLNDAECMLSLFKSTNNCNKKHKWTNVQSSTLLQYFTSTKELGRLLDIELRVIVKYLKKTKGLQIKESSSKRVKIEQLATYLGIEIEPSTSSVKKRHVKTLKELAGNGVSKIPKHELNVTYAEFIWPERFKTWKESSPVALDTLVNGETYDWFYVPEFSERRQQLELKCIDSTHLLTRTRRKICKGGIERLTNDPWLNVAKSGKTFLTPIMVQEITDPMSMDMAVTHFSEMVEGVMRDNGDDKAADICCDIRNWWDADDKAGISADDRISLKSGLRKRLLSYVNFGRFPPTGSHINGWPQQLWEAILANMDAKILLYPLCHGGSYNSRAFSSMIGETFFSELSLNDKRGQGTVTCEEFGKFISNSVEQLQVRLDPERSFAYSTKPSTVYRLVEDADVDVNKNIDEMCPQCESKGVYIPRCIVTKSHMFDNEGRRRLPGRRKQGTVNTSRNAVQKGATGVRWEKARVNESKMLPTKRMGLE